MRTVQHQPPFEAVLKFAAAAVGALLLSACRGGMPPLETVDRVDLERYMGDWYVIASIPTFVEDEAYNAVETYELADDGTIPTTFRFREGGFDGPVKTYESKAFVEDEESNAVWGVQFVWPIRADYRIIWLADDYSQTVVGRNQRDYVWIMARTPSIPGADYARMVEYVESVGYDVSELRKVPQRW